MKNLIHNKKYVIISYLLLSIFLVSVFSIFIYYNSFKKDNDKNEYISLHDAFNLFLNSTYFNDYKNEKIYPITFGSSDNFEKGNAESWRFDFWGYYNSSYVIDYMIYINIKEITIFSYGPNILDPRIHAIYKFDETNWTIDSTDVWNIVMNRNFKKYYENAADPSIGITFNAYNNNYWIYLTDNGNFDEPISATVHLNAINGSILSEEYKGSPSNKLVPDYFCSSLCIASLIAIWAVITTFFIVYMILTKKKLETSKNNEKFTKGKNKKNI